MAITGDALLVTLRMILLGQRIQTACFYTPGGAAFATANCDGVGEAWWNNTKDRWRAMVQTSPALASFESVVVEEFDGSGGLGEFAIPTLEKPGTRVDTADPTYLPSYAATGVRLSVPTRVTRPGQKRIPFMTRADVAGNVIQPGWLTLAATWAGIYSTTLTLGAPVLLGTLTAKVCSRDPADGHITAQQDITGFVINPQATSQVSRRVGHGL